MMLVLAKLIFRGIYQQDMEVFQVSWILKEIRGSVMK